MITSKEFLDFICVAAPRSGTTWLSEALSEHPQIWIPSIKELNFFNDIFLNHLEFKYPLGIDFYRKQFENAPPNAILGELTPTYYVDPKAAFRIHKHFPNVRILVLLRNPAEMVFSTYLKTREYEITEKTFELAIQKRPELIGLGFYHSLLTPYFDLFPKEQIYVGIYELFFPSLVEQCSAMYRFLGVDDTFRPSVLKRRINPRRAIRWQFVVQLQHYLRFLLNVSAVYPFKRLLSRNNFLDRISEKIKELNLKEGSTPKLDSKMKDRLMKVYDSDIARLEKLLDINLNIWRE